MANAHVGGPSARFAMHDSFVKETFVNLHKTITPLKKEVSNPVSDIVDSYYICKMFYDRINGSKS